MSDPVDVAAVPGIDDALAASLRELGLHTSADLLRTNRQALVAALPQLTLAQVRSWQTWAQLLEVRELPPAICSAALTAGIGSLDELASRPLASWRGIVDTAATGAPVSDDQLVAWLLDAVRVAGGGVLNGTVVDADGQPVQEVTARCDGVTGLSDARGRFRLVRLRLGVALTLELSHPVRGVKTFREVRATPLQALAGRRFAFNRRRTLPRRLSALHGDRLPPLGSAPVTTAAQQGPPAVHDVLRLIDRYANGDARAASRFFDHADGRFSVRTYRLATAAVAADAVPGDDLRHDGTRWARARVSAREIARLQRLQAARRRWTSAAVTDPELDRRARELLAALTD